MLPWYYNIPFFCIFLCMVGGIIMPILKSGRAAFNVTAAICLVTTVLSAILTAILYSNNEAYTYMMGHFPAPWGNELFVGPLEALLGVMFSGVTFCALLGGKNSLFEDILAPKQKSYFTMICMLVAAMMALSYTNDLFTGYVFIEISTLAACAIVMARDTSNTIVSTIRYLVISLLGSGLFLIGVVLLYCITGHLLMPDLKVAVLEIVSSGKFAIPLTMLAGLMMIGVGIKSALFPFFAWLPQAHGSATTTSSAILSGLVLKGYIILLVKIFYRVFTIEVIRSIRITDVMFAFGVAGIIFGSILAIKEEHIKRMLAYSSVAQIGYIFVGLGLGSDLGIAAAAFNILAHAVTKPLLFICAGRLSEVQGHEKSLFRMRGSALKDKLAGVGFTLGGLSMIGLPLLAGFSAKFFIMDATSLSPSKMWVTLIAMAVSSVLNALYYVPAIIAIWTPSSSPAYNFGPPGKPPKNPGVWVSVPILGAAVLALGTLSPAVLDIIERGLVLLQR